MRPRIFRQYPFILLVHDTKSKNRIVCILFCSVCILQKLVQKFVSPTRFSFPALRKNPEEYTTNWKQYRLASCMKRYCSWNSWGEHFMIWRLIWEWMLPTQRIPWQISPGDSLFEIEYNLRSIILRELGIIQIRIKSVLCHQRFMISLFDDGAVSHN